MKKHEQLTEEVKQLIKQAKLILGLSLDIPESKEDEAVLHDTYEDEFTEIFNQVEVNHLTQLTALNMEACKCEGCKSTRIYTVKYKNVFFQITDHFKSFYSAGRHPISLLSEGCKEYFKVSEFKDSIDNDNKIEGG